MSELRRKTFVELCVQGKVLPSEIDDYIEEWHVSEEASEIHDFLGMTWDEYSAYVAQPDLLDHIITAHLEGRNYIDVVTEAQDFSLAARSPRPEDAHRLMEWLDKNGYL